MLPQDTTHLIQRPCYQQGSPCQDPAAIGPHEDLLTAVKRCKLQWYGHVSRSSGLAKTILQGTVKGGRRQGRQRKGWEDNIRELDRPRVRQVLEGGGEQGKMEKTGCEIICAAPATLAVKGLMICLPPLQRGQRSATEREDFMLGRLALLRIESKQRW